MERLLLLPEEVAEALHVGRNKVYELMAAGELASVKLGRSRRVPLHAVEDLIQRKSAPVLP